MKIAEIDSNMSDKTNLCKKCIHNPCDLLPEAVENARNGLDCNWRETDAVVSKDEIITVLEESRRMLSRVFESDYVDSIDLENLIDKVAKLNTKLEEDNKEA